MSKRDKQQAAPTERTIKYLKVEASPDLTFTVERCKELLGYEEEPADGKWGDDYLIKDRDGKKVRCSNNIKNRPIYGGTIEALVQEHLNKRWRLNGEPIIIGKTAMVLNGQHTMLSAVFAEQDRVNAKKSGHWETVWDGPITFQKIVVFGIEESDDVINTMDTCKPRSLADVIYRSEYFSKMKPGDRKVASRMCDNAIRLLWYRTGASQDAWAPRRTHSEALDFIARHPKLLKCVKHIMEENQENAIGKYIGPGYASGLLYLMGSSHSHVDDYRQCKPAPAEKALDWINYDRACEFWIKLGSNSPEFKEVRYGLGALADEDTGVGGTLAGKTAVIIKAWLRFLVKEEITSKDVKLDYKTDEDGIQHLGECPVTGGIDLGVPEKKSKKEENLTPEQVEANKAAERKRRAEEIAERLKKAREAKASKGAETGNGKGGEKPPVKPALRPGNASK